MRDIYADWKDLSPMEKEKEVMKLVNQGWKRYILNVDGEGLYEVIEKNNIIRIIEVYSL